MALNVKINFDDCYEINSISSDLSLFEFNTFLINDNEVALGVKISSESHTFLPDVFNLAFGPLKAHKEIDDKIKLQHKNHSKVFSTIVFAAFTFLEENKDKYLGIDGSNNARAYMYYRCIQNNYDYLSDLFDIYGVNYYVRILRKIKDEDFTYPIDADDIKPFIEKIDKNVTVQSDKMYNYFIFRLKA
jgi:hypothetical protein